MNQNSITTFNQIMQSGLLGETKKKVYQCVYEFGPISLNDALDRIGLKTNNSGRFSDLHKEGVIKPGGIKTNAAGHTETLWVVTGNMPAKVEQVSLTDKSKALKAIEKLSKQVNQDDKDELRRIWTAINRMGL